MVLCRWNSWLSALAVLALLTSGVIAANAETAAKRYNVLFIAVDDLRPELGVYGSKALSPNIDRLATAGTVFENAYCQVALCMPSRASLLSGLRPDTIRMYAFDRDFRESKPNAVTLPEHFKNHGYQTLAFGKIFHKDDRRSWSEPRWRSKKPEYHTEHGKSILEAIRTDYRRLTFTWQLGDGFSKSKRMGGLSWEAPNVADNALREGDMTDEVIQTLQRVKDKPFFLAVGYHKPHLPFIAPKKYFDRYDPDQIKLATNPLPPKDSPAFAVYNWNDMRHYYGIPKIGPMPRDKARELKHAYYACVSYVDAQVGRLLEELDRLQLRQETVIVLWGDHGWQLGEHGMWDKHSNFETSTHSPLIISTPNQEPARTNALVEFVDIYPSLSELCSLPQPKDLEGASFAPLIEDPQRPWKSAAFSQYQRVIPGHGKGMGYSMRTKHHRFTEWRGARGELVATELYDHRKDPQENVNVAANPENDKLVQQLHTKLDAGWRAAAPKTRRPSE